MATYTSSQAAAPSANAVFASRIEHLRLSAIRPNPKNPRTHSKKQIAQIATSIERFGFNVPVLLDRNRQVIAGHGRLLAAAKLGLQEVPTIALAHLTPEQARAFMIADNRLTEKSEWDEALLVEQFEFLQGADLDFAISDTGFEVAEIDWLVDKRRRARRPDPDEAELPTSPAISQAGDLWLLGCHRVLCGDARSPESFARLLKGRLADMVFTDPPYNCRIDGHAVGKGEIHHREFAMASGEMSATEFRGFLGGVCRLMASNSADGSIHFICMDWRQAGELIAASKDTYAEQKNLCIWIKDNGGMGSLYRSQHELVFVFKNGTARHVNNVELGRHGRNRTNVWQFPGVNSFGRQTDEGNLLALHPTVKPIRLVVEAMLDCSNRGSLVLDPFLGSGTTLLAAEQCGRICSGMEIDPAYVDVIVRRWERLTGKHAVRNNAGDVPEGVAGRSTEASE